MFVSSDVEAAILQRDIDALLSLFFVSNQPMLRPTFRTETDFWEYKADCPQLGKRNENGWAHLAKDILAFYNNKGGVTLFGIDDDYRFVSATTRMDSKVVNEKLRRYIGDKFWIDYYRTFIRDDQRYLGLALIPRSRPFVGTIQDRRSHCQRAIALSRWPISSSRRKLLPHFEPAGSRHPRFPIRSPARRPSLCDR